MMLNESGQLRSPILALCRRQRRKSYSGTSFSVICCHDTALDYPNGSGRVTRYLVSLKTHSPATEKRVAQAAR